MATLACLTHLLKAEWITWIRVIAISKLILPIRLGGATGERDNANFAQIEVRNLLALYKLTAKRGTQNDNAYSWFLIFSVIL